ncbi:MAG: HAD-IA family hydrolase [Bacteroidota bacterium]
MQNKYPFDAVIFDLDGVITKTALVHSHAWKAMFDAYLREREVKHQEIFKEFTHENDYLPFVDGKPRYQGVQSFLVSRNINIPFGSPDDEPQLETVCSLGNRKNFYFNEILEKDGVEAYPSTVKLIHELIEKGIRVGVASSSKNCKVVLTAAKLIELFETRVDGEVSAEIGLKGKPEPDIFTTAADNLGVSYDRTVIVEDAISGVQAGKKGNFGLVLGLAREGNTQELLANGADIVVEDIEEIGFEGIVKWFNKDYDEDNWSLTYYDYDTAKERSRESLLTVGNGYFGCRGAMEETSANAVNYPGTYMAGLYNTLVSKVSAKDIENEDFVNATNFLPISFKIDDGEYLDVNAVKIISIKRNLDFKSGLLRREMIVKDKLNKITKVISFRFASMKDENLAAIEYKIEPLNYSGKITVKASLTANHLNAGVARYNDLNQLHLESLAEKSENNFMFVAAKTTQSNILISVNSKLSVYLNENEVNANYVNKTSKAVASTEFSFHLQQNDSLLLEKITVIKQWNETDLKLAEKFGYDKLSKILDFDQIIVESAIEWRKLWSKIDIQIEGDRLSQKMIRLHLYHLMTTNSPHNEQLDVSIPARGLNGEAYRGHIFWDEMFVLPVYFIHFKEIAKSILMYRYRRLDEARKYAKEFGFKGAMFPWQSGSSGKEETQKYHLNPANGKWGEDSSSLQRHVSLAIAYNILQYHHINKDEEFMLAYGGEMLIEICRLWESKASFNEKTQRYSIEKVMGPDEFHEKYPDAKEDGLRDNAYSNLMTIWMFNKTAVYLNTLQTDQKNKLFRTCNFAQTEMDHWMDIARKMNLQISNEGIIAQYDGYFDLKELDWEVYKKKYGNIYRMDRILKAENLTPDAFKVAKQADTLMLFYNLNPDEVTSMIQQLGYTLPENYVSKNMEYYLARTSHGSTLSRVVHAYLANLIHLKDIGWEMFTDALTSDYSDIQGGTTAEGIHTGVMAGTVWITLSTYGGIDLKGEIVHVKPDLPKFWKKLSFNFNFKNATYFCEMQAHEIKIRIESELKTVDVIVNNKKLTIATQNWQVIKL